MASDRIRKGLLNEWFVSPTTGDHITLPLDAAQYDDEAIDAAVSAWFSMAAPRAESLDEEYTQRMRAALAAYARHVAGGGA